MAFVKGVFVRCADGVVREWDLHIDEDNKTIKRKGQQRKDEFTIRCVYPSQSRDTLNILVCERKGIDIRTAPPFVRALPYSLKHLLLYGDLVLACIDDGKLVPFGIDAMREFLNGTSPTWCAPMKTYVGEVHENEVPDEEDSTEEESDESTDEDDEDSSNDYQLVKNDDDDDEENIEESSVDE